MVNARRRVKAIPPAAARRIAQAYGYDQVIVLGRRLDASGEEGEHVTAWGPAPRLPDRRARSRRSGRGVVVIPRRTSSQTQETLR